MRNALGDYLRGCGYRVIEAANSDEVRQIFDESSATVDAVLSDAALGGTMNAFELRIWVREHHPQVHIVLAGNVDAAVKAAGEMCDDGPHLKRPYEPEAVASHIKRLLAAARN